MISHFSQAIFEGTINIKDADLQKMAKVLNDVNIKECPYFVLSDKYGNSARYYRENQWIPVSERLPDSGKKQDVFVTINYLKYEAETDIWDGDSFLYYGEKVVAWMPFQFPEPYKEEEE